MRMTFCLIAPKAVHTSSGGSGGRCGADPRLNQLRSSRPVVLPRQASRQDLVAAALARVIGRLHL